MYPETSIARRRRPRRVLDRLFGEEEVVVPETAVPLTRPRRALPPEVLPAPQPVVEAVRPRTIAPPVAVADPNAPFGESGEPFGSVRPRRAEPRDFIADDAQYLRDLRTAPVEKSRAKSAGVGFLRGGILGGIVGALNPEAYGQMKRNREIKRVEDRIGSDLELQKAQRVRRLEPLQERLLESQVLENEAQAQARMRPPRPILGREVLEDGTTIQTELNPETGTFEPARGADGRPIVLSRPKPEAELIEMTLSDGRKVKVPAPAALTADATRTGRIERKEIEQAERERQRLAAQAEFEQLTSDEAAAGEAKNAAYKYLETLKKDPNVTEDDIREARKAAEDANTFYRTFGPRKAAVRSKITLYSDSTRPDRPDTSVDPLKGAKWYKSRYRGSRPIEEAAAAARARGAIIVD